jgi:hypothetical protein
MTSTESKGYEAFRSGIGLGSATAFWTGEAQPLADRTLHILLMLWFHADARNPKQLHKHTQVLPARVTSISQCGVNHRSFTCWQS